MYMNTSFAARAAVAGALACADVSMSACAGDEQSAVQTVDEPTQGSVSVTFTPFEDPNDDVLDDVVVATEPEMAPVVTPDDTLPAGTAFPVAPVDQPAPVSDVDAYGNQLASPHPNPELARSSRVQPLLTESVERKPRP